MARTTFGSSVGWLSALLLGGALGFAGCGGDGDGGGGTGGKAAGGATGSGGKATGGTTGKGGSGGRATGGATGSGGRATGGVTGTGGGGGGAGGSTVAPDGGIDAAGAGGGGGGTIGGSGGGAGGVGGVGGAPPIDGGPDAPSSTGGSDGGGIDGPIGIDAGADSSPVDVGPGTTMHVYVGCSDTSGSLQIFTLNTATAKLAPATTFLAGGQISNAEWNDAEDRLYVAHMLSGEAKVSTLVRNPTSGALSATGTPVAVPFAPPNAGIDGGTTSGNAGPQTLTFDRKRKFLAVPNYFSHYTYIYRMEDDGTVGALVSWHTAGNNAHHAVFTPNNDFVLVPYLGANLIQVYAFNESTGAITPSSNAQMATDSGPRHVALHANGKWLYAINEVAGGATSAAGTLDFFAVNQAAGTVGSVATFDVPLPDGYSGVKKGSEIEIGPAGDLLFVSMRLDGVAMGSLVAYRIDQNSGALTLIEQESSRGATPRQFTLSKDGRLLLVGNQDSDNLAIFRVDPATGDMTFVDDRDVCDSPRFAKLAAAK